MGWDRRWARRVDKEVMGMTALFAVGIAADWFFPLYIAGLWVQLVLPVSQLALIYGLRCHTHPRAPCELCQCPVCVHPCVKGWV